MGSDSLQSVGEKFNFNAHYRVNGWGAIAVYPVEHPEEAREEWTFIGGDPDDDANYDFHVDWITDESQVYVIMVGDDTRRLVDVDDLVKIAETDFCRDCGQIGCQCNVYE